MELDNYDPNAKFLKVGASPILDFCNTVILHDETCEEHLQKPQDAKDFLQEVMNVSININEKQFQNLIQLRGACREFFGSLIECEGSCSRTKKLQNLLDQHPMIFSLSGSPTRISTKVRDKTDAYLEPILVALYEFCRSMKVERLRKCKNPNCSLLFYDVSKNNTRSWCDMKSCGNIMKARAFYQRKKNAG
jgi:predicted RNA-binding Zn ribbon-like protein